MGKKSGAQRRLEQQKGRIQPPEHAPPTEGDDDPMKVLGNIKKQQLMEYYSGKYGLSPFLLQTVWNYLEEASPQKIKAIKRGQIKVNFKREEYTDGQVLKTGRVLDESGNEVVPAGSANASIEEIEADSVVIERADDVGQSQKCSVS
jgi:hypothetical protein